MDKLRLIFSKAREKLRAPIPFLKKSFPSGSTLLLAGSLAYLVYTFNRVDYAPLLSDLSEADLPLSSMSLKRRKFPIS